MQRIAKQIYNDILAARHILLIPHQNPDGDALGSCTAMMEFLSTLGKSHAAFCATPISPRLAFLPHADRVSNDTAVWQHPDLDLIIVFDSGDLRYAGVAEHVAALGTPRRIIAIDHHVTNERYGHINMVDHLASSTAEMLHRFFSMNDLSINTRMATSLLTGLLTDTDNFTNGATSASALSVGHDLMMKGADTSTIIASVFRDKTIHTLRLWGLTLSRLTKHETLDVVYTYVSQEDIETLGAKESDIEGIANYMNSIGEADVTLILKELNDTTWKGSLRTTKEVTDVSKIAKALGGGGHRKAAGFTVQGPIAQALQTVFDATQQLIA